MKRISKITFCITLLVLTITMLSGCTLLPYSVCGKTYEYSGMDYELTKAGENTVNKNYYGSEAAFLNSKSTLVYKRYVFNADGTGYFVLMLSNTPEQKVYGTWTENDDEVFFILENNGGQIHFEKTMLGLCVDLTEYLFTQEPEFQKFDVYYSEVE